MEELIQRLKKCDIHLKLKGESLDIMFTGGSLPAEILTELKANKEQLITYLKDNSNLSAHKIPAVETQDSYPLSSAQSRIWMACQSAEASRAYNIASAHLLMGSLNVNALNSAFKEIIKRHEVLSTVFRRSKGREPRQVILPDLFNQMEIEVCNASTEQTIGAVIENYAAVNFDLENGPLIKMMLIQQSKAQSVLVFCMHHIISDGSSIQQLFTELFTLYHCFNQNKPNPFEPLRIQYKDYSSWQLEQLNGVSYEMHKNFWVKQFEGDLPLLELPSDYIRPAIKTHNGNARVFNLGGERTRELRNYCLKSGGTVYMGIIALVNVCLHKLSGNRDLIIGTTSNGREETELAEQIGYFVNTIAIRSKVELKDSFNSLFMRTKEIILGSFEHAVFPFENLLEYVQVKRDASRSVLFDVIVDYQKTIQQEQFTAAGLTIDSFDQPIQFSSKFDLTFNFEDIGNEIILKLEYNTDLFKDSTISYWIDIFENLVKQLLQDPSKEIKYITGISDKEHQRLLHAYNPELETPFGKDETIVGLFERQVKEKPLAIAIRTYDIDTTYQELNTLSNQFAHWLKNKHAVKRGDYVGLTLDKSLGMMVTILGALKAGAAYVPIDFEYPEERIKYMLDECECKLLVNQTVYNEFEQQNQDHSGENPFPVNSTADTIANILFTSGSTGKPKGVLTPNRGIIRTSTGINFNRFKAPKVIYSTSSLSFDPTNYEYWAALLNGGRLILGPKTTLLNERAFKEVLDKNNVKFLWLTTGFFNQLSEANSVIFNDVETVLVGGEKLLPVHTNKLRLKYPNLDIVNIYGPTENSSFSTYYFAGHEGSNVPVGKPLCHSSVYILNDTTTEIQPQGIVGEICVGGYGLAKGYLKRPELTAEKFIEHPVLKGKRIYRTGDLGRWLPNGNVEFLGRKDDQVKIRGFRIELGEIEYQILQIQGVDAGVVTTTSDASGDNTLVAFVCLKDSLTTDAIKNQLSNILPSYMIPPYIIQVPFLPLTPNGKVDKKTLPYPEEICEKSGVNKITPRNPQEQQMLKIWSELLNFPEETIGVTETFFSLGGHSLKAFKLINRIHDVFNVEIDASIIFKDPSIETLVKYIEAIKATEIIIPQGGEEMIF